MMFVISRSTYAASRGAPRVTARFGGPGVTFLRRCRSTRMDGRKPVSVTELDTPEDRNHAGSNHDNHIAVPDEEPGRRPSRCLAGHPGPVRGPWEGRRPGGHPGTGPPAGRPDQRMQLVRQLGLAGSQEGRRDRRAAVHGGRMARGTVLHRRRARRTGLDRSRHTAQRPGRSASNPSRRRPRPWRFRLCSEAGGTSGPRRRCPAGWSRGGRRRRR